jgi:endonuclease YncB( thermonuclease family)
MGCGLSKWTMQNTTDGLRVRDQRVRVIKVVDGDTIHVAFDTGERDRVRLLRVNAAEMKTKDGPAHKDLLSSMIDQRIVRIEPQYPKPRDAFGRILAEVWLGSENMSDFLLSRGVKP